MIMYKFYYETQTQVYTVTDWNYYLPIRTHCVAIETRLVSGHGGKRRFIRYQQFWPHSPSINIRKQMTRFWVKMKFETGSTPPLKFVSLKAKMYSLLCENRDRKKLRELRKFLVKIRPLRKFPPKSNYHFHSKISPFWVKKPRCTHDENQQIAFVGIGQEKCLKIFPLF